MARPQKIKPVVEAQPVNEEPVVAEEITEEPKAPEAVEKPKMRCLKCTSNGGRIYAWDEHSASRDDMIEVWIERP